MSAHARTHKLVSVVTLATLITSLALPPVAWTQSLPTGPPTGPPGGHSAEPLAAGDVAGEPGGVYSRFHLVVYPSPDGSNTMDLTVPSSMPEIEVSAFVEQPWGEELALAVRVSTPVWTAINVFQETLQLFTALDLEHLTPSEEQDLAGVVDGLLATIDTTVFGLPSGASDMLAEMAAAAEANGLVAAGGGWMTAGCVGLIGLTAAGLAAVTMTQVDLIGKILTSPFSCLNPEPTLVSKILCGEQVALWTASMGGTAWAGFYLAATGVSFGQFQYDIAQDRVGSDLTAGQALAGNAASSAKDVESSARGVWQGLGAAGAAIGILAILSFQGLDVWVGSHAAFTGATLGAASASWGLAHGCLRAVVPPRLQASVIRNRLFLHTNNGLVALPVAGSNVLTAIPRHLAKIQVIEIDADALFAQNPAWLPEFDEATQRQDLTVSICEGVVVGADPEPRASFPQQAGTDYWIGDLGSGASCLSEWWLGVTPTRTNMVRKHHAATIHRACESTGLIDNNNDGHPDTSVDEHCVIVQSQPPGEIEEDIALVPVNVDIHGATAWSSIGGDMVCNAGTLSLVSRDGAAGKEVRQEYVANTASCWTDESGNQVSAYHPHDSTQIRFALSDDDWGAPRPRGCFGWDAASQRWACNGNAGCPCGHGSPGTPPLP